jgi:hypothetical protein
MKNACTYHSQTANISVSIDTETKKVRFEFKLTDEGVNKGYGMARWLDSIMYTIAESLVEIYSKNKNTEVLGRLFTSSVKKFDGGSQDRILQSLENDKVGEWALVHILEDSIFSSENFEVEFDLNEWLFHAIHLASEYDRLSNAWAEYYAEQARELEDEEEG